MQEIHSILYHVSYGTILFNKMLSINCVMFHLENVFNKFLLNRLVYICKFCCVIVNLVANMDISIFTCKIPTQINKSPPPIETTKSTSSCNLTVKIGASEFTIVEDVLKHHCKYFGGVQRMGGTETQSNSVELDSSIIPPHIFAIILEYFTTGSISWNLDNIQDVLVAANYLLADELLQACVKYCINATNMSNVIEMHKLSLMDNMQDLAKHIEYYLLCSFEEFFRLPHL